MLWWYVTRFHRINAVQATNFDVCDQTATQAMCESISTENSQMLTSPVAKGREVIGVSQHNIG